MLAEPPQPQIPDQRHVSESGRKVGTLSSQRSQTTLSISTGTEVETDHVQCFFDHFPPQLTLHQGATVVRIQHDEVGHLDFLALADHARVFSAG